MPLQHMDTPEGQLETLRSRAVKGYVIVNDKTGRMVVNRYDNGALATLFFSRRMARRFLLNGERIVRVAITEI